MNARPLPVRASVRTLTAILPVAVQLALLWRLTLPAAKVRTGEDHDDVINGNIFSVSCTLCGEFTGHR